MRLSAIISARVLAFLELAELNPKGRVFLPSLVPHLVARFNFQKSPAKIEEFDLGKGVEFELGYFADTTVTKMVFYNDGISLDARSSSSEAREILVSTLEWLATDYGLEFAPTRIKRWGYVTSLTFHSDADLTLLHPVLARACEHLSKVNADLGRGEVEFKVTRIALDFDRYFNQRQQAPFVLEKLNASSFADHKFFSESPLPSEIHIQFIEELEAGILGGK